MVLHVLVTVDGLGVYADDATQGERPALDAMAITTAEPLPAASPAARRAPVSGLGGPRRHEALCMVMREGAYSSYV
nr:hypothetical protein StreXyl84_60470 [Streptomyces sp. Xyl84]